MFNLTGKVALITGGSRGLGRADALALAKAGADVVITDILAENDAGEGALKSSAAGREPSKESAVYAEQTAAEIGRLGGRAAVYRMDVTDEKEVARVVASVIERFGHIDILVNNAAMLDHVATIENQSEALWARDLQINLTGAYNCARAVWPHMKEQRWGRIINMASVAGTMGGFGQTSYSSTKAGIIGLTKSLALEGARYQITSNAIVPGIIATEAWKKGNPKMNERMIARTAFRRPGEPADIAHTVVFLASVEASYITGIELYVSGGIELFTF